MSDPELERAVRRTVGLAALRRIRQIVDAEIAREQAATRLARWLAPLLAVAAVAVVAWIAFH